MKDERSDAVVHGVSRLPAVTVGGYSTELRSGDGFLGDRASNSAFRAILDEWRERLRKVGADPLGDTPTEELSKKKLDKVLAEGDPEAAGLLQSAIEQFAQELVTVITRFIKLKTWREIERIVVGGGMRASRIGELAIGRAAVLLKASGLRLDVRPVHHHPDEAGLVGAVHLVPGWMLAGHDAILAVDIGGSNIRSGIVTLDLKKKPNLAGCAVHEIELWRYAEDEVKPTRDQAVDRIGAMLDKLVKRADKQGLKVAPFVGLACPGVITADGSIEKGGQNLPGNWESGRFNLPARVRELVPCIGKHEVTVLMHNDAVVQGLSEVPFTQDVERWSVLTIGTGLGNATFANRRDGDVESSRGRE
jgi:predicted NBD/HSP70 family sugar kinase